MSTYYVNVFAGISLLMSVVTGYFFSERNSRKMFLLSSLVFLIINIMCVYVLTVNFWFLCGAVVNQCAALVVPMAVGTLPDVTKFDRFRRIFICIMLSSVWSGVMWFFIKILVKT
ncbi:TPA: conjugal transfer protein TrbA [Salmonella enterica]|uniref:conjugal transfer protein TrbA n=1 Tax=Salmonella enterica TaxID=28901 RepID=UPI0009B1951A|nr:conjugal transfer protein TrbA [Salmonella enterica]EBY6848860.1 conjugal transfer protein TrbA [Salmonella enterica subsp. enterica serovar Bonn]MLZ42476.1 conjugal transfer protein TrbA [Salmonella enterica subsp. enterica serovar Bonn]HAK5317189.1 conjugal transfer protein TrbA [Salmonella enterica]